MSSEKYGEDVLTTHTYDGIQEYDNPMPAWWTLIFAITTVWAAVYVVGMSLDFLPDYDDKLRAEMAIQKQLEEAAKQDLPPVTPEMLAEAAANDETVALGAEVFAMNCATCHGNQGQGQIGPNLTDNAWISGDGSLQMIHDVVSTGTPNGMPAWSAILLQDQLVAVTAYAKSLQGTSPPDPKAPEGKVPGEDSTEENPTDG